MSAADRLTAAREKVARLERALEAAHGKSEGQTIGGLSGYDPAVLSGIRRKPNRKADARRFAAYDREAALYRDLAAAQRDVQHLEAQAAREATEAADRASLTPEAIKAARFVRDGHGWHRVVRVSAKSVTVETPWSWTDRIPLDRLLEAKP